MISRKRRTASVDQRRPVHPAGDIDPSQRPAGEVVDYSFIRDTLYERTSKGHINLQETLCDDLAKMLLSHPQVMAVRVSTEKPDVYEDCDSIGVEIFRFKDED